MLTETDPSLAILRSMRVGDAIVIRESDGAVMTHDRVQPVQVKPDRVGRNKPSKTSGTRPITAAELGALQASDTRILSICPDCGHGESVDAHQIGELCREHGHKKVVFAFGCNHCGAKENGLVLWTALAKLDQINSQLMPKHLAFGRSSSING